MSRACTIVGILLLVTALGGCQTTEPLPAASIGYRLPRTDAIAKLDLTLEECGATDFTVVAELVVISKPGAEPGVHRISGAALASVRIKRALQIAVSDEGVITGINSANADQTPTIIGNVVKSVISVGGLLTPALAPPKGPPELQCLDEVVAATQRVRIIRTQIARLRAELAKSDPSTGPSADDLRRIRQINTLAREYAALRTGPLRVETTGQIKLAQPANQTPEPPQPISLKLQPFGKWFGPKVETLGKPIQHHFGLQWTATLKPGQETPVNGNEKKFRPCGLKLPVPQVQPVEVRVKAAGASFKGLDDATEVMPVAQWLGPAYLCADVGFGESRAITLAFDKYGRTKDFNWSSEATGAAVSGAIAGVTADVAGFAKSLRGPTELERQKQQIDELKTQKELNALLACQSVIDAGGFECEAEEGDQ